jgi:hypothetical protein
MLNAIRSCDTTAAQIIQASATGRLLQSFDLGDAVTVADTQELHLHTKARMGNIPIVAVVGVVDERRGD